jgi:hypothetical protein
LAEVEVLDKQTKQMKYNLSKLCWHMRGGLSLTEAYELSPEDREVMGQLIKDNFEVAKKTGQPYW